MDDKSASPPTNERQTDFLVLIAAAKDGCSQAMDQLIRECQPHLLAIANVEIDTRLSPKVGASDIVQNSILSAQRCIGDFQGDNREELLAWLRGILIKDLKQTHRHYQAAKRHVGRERPLRDDNFAIENDEPLDQGQSPSMAAAEREQEERLYRAMRVLSDQERQVIELRNWQRLPFADIGQRMDRSAEAARKLWSRAIIRLQRLMDEVDA